MATTDVSLTGRSRRLSPKNRTQLEDDITEIRAQLENAATKADIERLERRIDSHTADILEAIHGKDATRPATG